MPKPPPVGPKPGQAPDDLGETLETGFYEAAPTEIDRSGEKLPAGRDVGKLLDEALQGPADTDPQWAGPAETGAGPERRRPPAGPRIAAVVAVLAVAAGGALWYRDHHRRQVLAQGLARARDLLVLDTYAGYRDAAQILEPLVPIDPVEAGSVRAFALAMLAADYRDQEAARQAEALLLEPERSPAVPPAASLARAALALARREAGTATSLVARAGGGPWAGTLEARVALLAGNPSAAVEPLESALSADPRFPAALALRGDVLRRGKSFRAARESYAAALEISPREPRSAFGLAKLALAGRIPAPDAMPALQALLADRAGTPANERGRAALHLAALRRRAGDRAGAQAALEAVELDAASRAWLERAATQEELDRSAYRVVSGAPAPLVSASDDDPYEPPSPAVERPPAKAKATAKAKAKAKIAKKASKKVAKKKAAKKAKKAAKKKPAGRTPGRTGAASSP